MDDPNPQVERKGFWLDVYRGRETVPCITLRCRCDLQPDIGNKWAQSCSVCARSIPTVGSGFESDSDPSEPPWMGNPKGFVSDSRDDYAVRYEAYWNAYLKNNYGGRWSVRLRAED